jgi:hypothetical protein
MSTQPPDSTLTPIRLTSDRLAVEIARPGTTYARTRFDWTAFIVQVTLDAPQAGSARHTFCVPEDLDPAQGTGGIGLCGEFGIEQAIGYDDAQPGECFPKLGIGLLRRADESPYSFMHPYEIVARFPIQIETAENQARFVVQPLDCRGYAARVTKTVTVQGTALTIAYQLQNVGQRPIHTTEYVHNFAGIDGHLMGPDYRLSLPQNVRFEKPQPAMLRPALPRFLRKVVPDALLAPVARFLLRRMSHVLVVKGREITLQRTPERPFYRRLVGYIQTDQPQWELVHSPSGVGMRETDDFAPCRVALWGTTHVISAEIFCPLDVQPGETQTWTRRYEFFAGPI